MQFLIIFLLALASSSVAAEPNQNNEGRIVNGTPAANGQVPYQAGLFTNSGFFCGCVLYNNCCLTAAHCLAGVTSGRVIYGTTDVYTNSSYQNFTFSDIRIHRAWNRRTLRNDIGLIKLPKELPTSALIQSVQLSCSAAACGVNDTLTVCGWGKTSDNSTISKSLQCTELQTVSQEECNKYFRIKLAKTQLCVGSLNNSSACNGDSGSPGVSTTTKTGCGLVSFGSVRGCENAAPTVFTKLSSYRDWIEQFCN